MAAEEHPDRGDGNVRVSGRRKATGHVPTIEPRCDPRNASRNKAVTVSRSDSEHALQIGDPPLVDLKTAKPTNQRAEARHLS